MYLYILPPARSLVSVGLVVYKYANTPRLAGSVDVEKKYHKATIEVNSKVARQCGIVQCWVIAVVWLAAVLHVIILSLPTLVTFVTCKHAWGLHAPFCDYTYMPRRRCDITNVHGSQVYTTTNNIISNMDRKRENYEVQDFFF